MLQTARSVLDLQRIGPLREVEVVLLELLDVALDPERVVCRKHFLESRKRHDMLEARNTDAYLECDRSALEDPGTSLAGRHVVQTAVALQSRRVLSECDQCAVALCTVLPVVWRRIGSAPHIVSALYHEWSNTDRLDRDACQHSHTLIHMLALPAQLRKSF